MKASGANEGTCQAPAAGKDCNAFNAKCTTCEGLAADTCSSLCTAASTACVSCYNDSNCGAGCETVCDFGS